MFLRRPPSPVNDFGVLRTFRALLPLLLLSSAVLPAMSNSAWLIYCRNKHVIVCWLLAFLSSAGRVRAIRSPCQWCNIYAYSCPRRIVCAADARSVGDSSVLVVLDVVFGKLVPNPSCVPNWKLLASTVAKIFKGSQFFDSPLAQTIANFGPKRCCLVS